MATTESRRVFNEIVGKLVVNDTLCELVLRDPDAVVDGASRVLTAPELAAIDRIVGQLRSNDPRVVRIVERVMSPADRSLQK